MPCAGAGAEPGDRFPTTAHPDLNRVLARVRLGTSLRLASPFLSYHPSPPPPFFIFHSIRVTRTFWGGDEF